MNRCVPPDQFRRLLAGQLSPAEQQALDFTDEFLQSSRDSGVSTFLFDPARDVVMGHELSARVISAGPDTPYTEGQVVVALPWALDGAGKVHGVGFSNEFPGGYGEKMVLQAMELEPVPEHVQPHVSALTEPLAVG